MNKNLLIVGAGVYGLVTKEIAESLGSFEKISFIDDNAESAPDGTKVVGKISDIDKLIPEYQNIVVAIGNSRVRLELLQSFSQKACCHIVALVSPRAYVSPSAQIEKGCIIEPMAVVHAGCVLKTGCIISAGAVVNHASTCCDGVHVDCNATVPSYSTVPPATKVYSGTVFKP